MLHINGSVVVDKLIITDTFVDFRLFTVGKPISLNRAAIIPLEDYGKLLQIAEDYEKLQMLQPLVDVLKQRELKSMDDAQTDKNLLGAPDDGTDK